MAIRTQVCVVATGGCMRWGLCIGRRSDNVVELIWNEARTELLGCVRGICDAAANLAGRIVEVCDATGNAAADLASRIVEAVSDWCDNSTEDWLRLGLGVASSAQLTVFVGSWEKNNLQHF